MELNDDERAELKGLLAGGKGRARKLKRAQILLAADGGQSDAAIAASVGIGTSTVYRTKQHFVEGNLEYALAEKLRPGAKRKLSSKEEALLVARTCSAPPAGRARWTLELLASAMVALTDHEELSRETVRRRLGENKLKPWRQEMWCIPEINAEYVARMEDVLDLYAEAPDPLRPVVSFDESPTQLIGEVREPIPAEPGKLQRYDSEYCRNGTVNLFIFYDVHRGWRHVKITDRRTSVDFAECMRELVDVYYPEAERIRIAIDNLSTHSLGALYEAFAPEEARRILRRLEFHFVPKHASWLNMVEIEIGVLRAQCLDRRIDNRATLETEVAAWERERNASQARIEWMFTTETARVKMGRAYPVIATANAPTKHNVTNPVSQALPAKETEPAQNSPEPDPCASSDKETANTAPQQTASDTNETSTREPPEPATAPKGMRENVTAKQGESKAKTRGSAPSPANAPTNTHEIVKQKGQPSEERSKPRATPQKWRTAGPRTHARATDAQLAPRRRKRAAKRSVKTTVQSY